MDIASFLGGGVLVAIFNWITRSASERVERRHEYLKRQLENLYSPLYFLTSSNDGLFDLYNKYMKKYDEEYSGKRWSQEEHTQKALKEEVNDFFKIANDYMRIVKENNNKLVQVLNDNYMYIDPDDIEHFKKFIIDYYRMKNEMDRPDDIKLPSRIVLKFEKISYMRPAFISRVREKFNRKSLELKSLHSDNQVFIFRVKKLFKDRIKKIGW
jgi:hypothetical protein